MKFGAGVNVQEVVAWAEFDLENLTGFILLVVKIWASPLSFAYRP